MKGESKAKYHYVSTLVLLFAVIVVSKPQEVSAKKKWSLTKVEDIDVPFEHIYMYNTTYEEGLSKLKKNKDGSYTLIMWEGGEVGLKVKGLNEDYYIDVDKKYKKMFNPNNGSLGMIDCHDDGYLSKDECSVTIWDDALGNKKGKIRKETVYLKVYKPGYITLDGKKVKEKVIGSKIKLNIIIKSIVENGSKQEDAEYLTLMKKEMGYKENMSKFEKVLLACLWVQRNFRYTSNKAEYDYADFSNHAPYAIRIGKGGSEMHLGILNDLLDAMKVENMYIKYNLNPLKYNDSLHGLAVKIDGKWYTVDTENEIKCMEEAKIDCILPFRPLEKYENCKLPKGAKKAKKYHPNVIEYHKQIDNLKQEYDNKFNNIDEYITQKLMDEIFGEGTYNRYIKLMDEETLNKDDYEFYMKVYNTIFEEHDDDFWEKLYIEGEKELEKEYLAKYRDLNTTWLKEHLPNMKKDPGRGSKFKPVI